MRAPYGTAEAMFQALAAQETDECVVWPYSVNSWGYGQVHIDGRTHNTHRLALTKRTPPPAAGLEAAHADGCPKACLNCRHLRWATPSENTRDRDANGHYRQRAS